jgi:hypothetical protein
MTDLRDIAHLLHDAAQKGFAYHEAERACTRAACEQLGFALTRLEGAMTATAGNDERRLALATQCLSW